MNSKLSKSLDITSMLVEKAIEKTQLTTITEKTAENIGNFYEVIFKKVYGLIKEVEENKTI
mgnify:CR=1 FL=1